MRSRARLDRSELRDGTIEQLHRTEARRLPAYGMAASGRPFSCFATGFATEHAGEARDQTVPSGTFPDDGRDKSARFKTRRDEAGYLVALLETGALFDK
jgi:hypothetical protein